MSGQDDILGRVHALLLLAGGLNTPPERAHPAAVEALQLIRAHGFDLEHALAGRARKLLALAGGPATPPEEAHAAAVAAMRVIQTHDLVLAKVSASPALPARSTVPHDAQDDGLDVIFGRGWRSDVARGRAEPTPPLDDDGWTQAKSEPRVPRKRSGT